MTSAATFSSSLRTVIFVVTPVFDEKAIRTLATTRPPPTVLPRSLSVWVVWLTGTQRALPVNLLKGHVDLARLISGKLLSLDDEHLLELLVIGRGSDNGDVLENSIGQGVLNLVLEDNVLLEDVLDQSNNVLSLSLSKLDKRGRLENTAKLLHLGDLQQLLGVSLSRSRRRSNSLGSCSLGGANLRSLEGRSSSNQLLGSILSIGLFSSNHRNLGDIEGAVESRLVIRGDVQNKLLLKIFLTVLDESSSHLIVLLVHEAKVEGSTVTDLIIDIVQAADVSDVLGRLGSLGTLETNKVGKRILLRIGNKLDQIKHALNDSPLELVATLVAQNAAKEASTIVILNSSVISDMKRGDGEGSNGSVAVGDEELNIGVAGVDGGGLEAGEVVENSESGKLGDSAGRGEEELENVDSLRHLGIGNITHVADGLGSLEVDHFALIVVLRHGRVVHGDLAARGGESKGEATGGLVRSSGLLGLALPSSDDILGDWEEMVGGNQGGRRHGGVLVDNCGLHHSGVGVPASKATYIDNSAESTDSVGSVDGIGAASGILHNRAGNHNNILSRVGELLNDKVDHLSEAGILVLEELGDAEEEGGGFVGRELLPCVEEESDLCEENATSSRLDRGAVEESCCRTI
ncbi:hypothetical protein HG530_001983 [Fusarium avenaceum]|nr:hypothetical protein HG530_001983 [Fusarium avenaceum]